MNTSWVICLLADLFYCRFICQSIDWLIDRSSLSEKVDGLLTIADPDVQNRGSTDDDDNLVPPDFDQPLPDSDEDVPLIVQLSSQDFHPKVSWYGDFIRGILPREVYRFKRLTLWKKIICVICVRNNKKGESNRLRTFFSKSNFSPKTFSNHLLSQKCVWKIEIF